MVDSHSSKVTSVNQASAFSGRLRQARLAAGLTQDQVVESLARPITKQALSKFERGKARPSPPVLLALASALGVKPSWLLSEPATSVTWTGYRKHSRLSKGDQASIEAHAALRTEVEVRLRALFNLAEPRDFPRHEATTLAKAEEAADRVREQWRLGTDPIASLAEVIESRRGILITISSIPRFDGLSGFTAEGLPVVIITDAAPVDRLRFNLAHELGHLVLDCDTCSPAEQEKLAHRFAGALLAPAAEITSVLGQRRRHLDLEELVLIKRQWGISMQAAMHRARDLDIISEATFRSLNIRFRKRHWHREEPGECPFEERPSLLEALALRAFAEDLISHRDLRDLLDHSAPPVQRERRPGGEGPSRTGRPSLRELARMPREQRHRYLAGAEIASEDAENWDATDAAELRKLDR